MQKSLPYSPPEKPMTSMSACRPGRPCRNQVFLAWTEALVAPNPRLDTLLKELSGRPHGDSRLGAGLALPTVHHHRRFLIGSGPAPATLASARRCPCHSVPAFRISSDPPYYIEISEFLSLFYNQPPARYPGRSNAAATARVQTRRRLRPQIVVGRCDTLPIRR